MKKPKLQVHRWVVCLARRYERKDDLNGVIARRLLAGVPPTPENVKQWIADLRHMAKLAWALTPHGTYAASLREQGASLAVQELLDRHAAQEIIDLIEQERRTA
jgi:hypothetical protein